MLMLADTYRQMPFSKLPPFLGNYGLALVAIEIFKYAKSFARGIVLPKSVSRYRQEILLDQHVGGHDKSCFLLGTEQ